MTDLSKLSESDAVSFAVVEEIRDQAEGCWEPTIRGATEIAKAVLVAAVRAGDLVEKDQCRPVKVKPLEWVPNPDDDFSVISTVLGVKYEAGVDVYGDVYWGFWRDVSKPVFDVDGDLSDAEAAAQAHHEADIRARLEPDPETERLLKERAEYRLKYGPLKGGA
ncbi:hypothetical protein OU789_10985 [Halocynthiibacter sp. C4]|uniref:hypothetical protein n=1 Tax=Halocynthiibacter sp. C4 TaxID=2992758 RepID=UPI00237C44D6|nr:hypothetical protein [Halocynthiibacter sp. C4]MDE0590452.1 hypothetical protein [Halocynthiibacter sp. C4]